MCMHQLFVPSVLYFQGVHSSKVVVAAYGIEKMAEPRWDGTRRKHDSMSDAEEGETGDDVCKILCHLIIFLYIR